MYVYAHTVRATTIKYYINMLKATVSSLQLFRER